MIYLDSNIWNPEQWYIMVYHGMRIGHLVYTGIYQYILVWTSMSKYIPVYTKHTFSRKVYASMYCAMGHNNIFLPGVVLWCLNMKAYICHAQYIISCSQNILKSENTMFIPSFRYTGYILVYTCMNKYEQVYTDIYQTHIFEKGICKYVLCHGAE